ncbi:hypothetical protein LMG33818_000700 [Halomonadaceae bacterium LMG 33818]
MQWLSDALGGPAEQVTRPFQPCASPGWRGVDADIWVGERAGHSLLLKSWHPETSFYIEPSNSVVAAAHASQWGIGPKLPSVYERLCDSSSADHFVMEYLGKDWRVAGLQDMASETFRAAVIAAKQLFQHARWEQHRALPRVDPFEEVIGLAARLSHAYMSSESPDKAGIYYPVQLPEWMTFVQSAQRVIHTLGRDECPVHRESDVSNLMVHATGIIRLLDYDSAARSDRFEDVGLFLFEAFEHEDGAREGFEQWLGYFDEGEYQRSWLYGVLDNLRWGLIASLRSAYSPHSSLEFAKYAGWRFFRAQQTLQAPWKQRLSCVR